MRIGLDCDGILYDWESRAREMLYREFGVNLPISSEWNSIQNAISTEQWNWLWGDKVTSLFRYGAPYYGSDAAVEKLREMGDVVIITSIPKIAITYRLDWFHNNGFYFDEFRVVNGMKDKSKVVPLCDVYIDDSPEVADDILEHTDAKMILWNRPWNMGENAPKSRRQYWRVDSWAEVIALCESVKELYA